MFLTGYCFSSGQLSRENIDSKIFSPSILKREKIKEIPLNFHRLYAIWGLFCTHEVFSETTKWVLSFTERFSKKLSLNRESVMSRRSLPVNGSCYFPLR